MTLDHIHIPHHRRLVLRPELHFFIVSGDLSEALVRAHSREHALRIIKRALKLDSVCLHSPRRDWPELRDVTELDDHGEAGVITSWCE